MNPHLSRLQPYPFERLAHLFEGVVPAPSLARIALSIGEPQHPPPAFVYDILQSEQAGYGRYPTTRGSDALREAIAQWLQRRFELARAPDPGTEILPVNGTREALFAITQAMLDPATRPLVIMPNPFYQIYEGATLMAGGKVVLLDCLTENNYLPVFEAVDEATWAGCGLIYLCSPGNPNGQVIDLESYRFLLEKADQHGFVIASDECYSEIYLDEARPPLGLLAACAQLGREDFRHCLVFHSLSKRSNCPGLRSGFVAGDERLIAAFLRYRTYHGCSLPMPVQAASTALWQDESHVVANRAAYREKFAMADSILGASRLDFSIPPASFYLWPRTPIDDETFARELYREEHVVVLPGSYLGREGTAGNPGAGHVRMALVAGQTECREALERIARFVSQLDQNHSK